MAETHRRSGGYWAGNRWVSESTPAGEGHAARDKEKFQDTSPLVAAAAKAAAERKRKASSQAKAVEAPAEKS